MPTLKGDEENIGLFLTKRALLCPDHEALVETETARRLTYRQLNSRCNQAAHALAEKGLVKGDRVALLFKNSAEYVELFFALAKLGAVMVPLNWRLAPPELEFILSDAGATVLAFDVEFEETVLTLRRNGKTPVEHWISSGAEASSEAGENYRELKRGQSREEPEVTAHGDDLLFIMYTSGTTGLPKGAMHSHASQLWASLTWMAVVDLRPTDRMLIFLPPLSSWASSFPWSSLSIGASRLCCCASSRSSRCSKPSNGRGSPPVFPSPPCSR